MKTKLISAIALAVAMNSAWAGNSVPAGAVPSYIQNENDIRLDAKMQQGQSQAQQQNIENKNVNENYSQSTSSAVGVGIAVSNSKANNNVSNNVDSYSSSGASSANIVSVHNEKHQVSSPASVALSACQEGGSGQGVKGGLSTVVDSPQCSALRQAAVHFELYEVALNNGEYQEAEKHLEKAEKYVDKADSYVNITHAPKTIGSVILGISPLAILALVF